MLYTEKWNNFELIYEIEINKYLQNSYNLISLFSP